MMILDSNRTVTSMRRPKEMKNQEVSTIMITALETIGKYMAMYDFVSVFEN